MKSRQVPGTSFEKSSSIRLISSTAKFIQRLVEKSVSQNGQLSSETEFLFEPGAKLLLGESENSADLSQARQVDLLMDSPG